SAAGGCVVLRGPVLASEYNQIVEAAACVGGVMALTEELELHKQPDDVPALQGGTRHPLPRPELLQENWAPGIRVLMGAASAGLIGLGAARRDLPGSLIAGCGVLLLARSATNLPVRRLIGERAGRELWDGAVRPRGRRHARRREALVQSAARRRWPRGGGAARRRSEAAARR